MKGGVYDAGQVKAASSSDTRTWQVFGVAVQSGIRYLFP